MKNLIFRFRKRKKVKPYKVDTSQKGFEYVGIKLSDEQFQDMCNLNLLWANDRKDIPVELDGLIATAHPNTPRAFRLVGYEYQKVAEV